MMLKVNIFVFQFRSLHDAGQSLTVCDTSGRTPLHLAAKHGSKEIVNYIVRKGKYASNTWFLQLSDHFSRILNHSLISGNH